MAGVVSGSGFARRRPPGSGSHPVMNCSPLCPALSRSRLYPGHPVLLKPPLGGRRRRRVSRIGPGPGRPGMRGPATARTSPSAAGRDHPGLAPVARRASEETRTFRNRASGSRAAPRLRPRIGPPSLPTLQQKVPRLRRAGAGSIAGCNQDDPTTRWPRPRRAATQRSAARRAYGRPPGRKQVRRGVDVDHRHRVLPFVRFRARVYAETHVWSCRGRSCFGFYYCSRLFGVVRVPDGGAQLRLESGLRKRLPH